MTSFGNVYFLGVARVDPSPVVVANYSYHSEIDIDGVKKVLGEPNLNLQAGKHYSFAVNQVAWHLISGMQLYKVLVYYYYYYFTISLSIIVYNR